MKLKNVEIITKILLLSQLRLRRESKRQSWYRTPKGLMAINLAVFVATFAALYAILKFIPEDVTVWLYPFAVQILSTLPLITLSFIVLYGILFIIGESSQYASSEMVNYMPVSTTEYVLGSSFSTIYMYLYILTAALGLSLAVALPCGLFGVWGAAALLSAFFMVVGGFVAEIIRALVNRVSSTFSKRGGRSAILTRGILIIIVLVVSQLFFNPNLLFRALQWFAPQLQALWFIPIIWPSLVVAFMAVGNTGGAALYGLLTVAFGMALMGLGVFLRSRYWAPIPVSMKLGGGKAGTYGGRGMLGSLGMSQPEAALVRKDLHSLFRRKEMVRFLALPVVIMVPMLLSFSPEVSSGMDYLANLSALSGTCLMGSSMFGLLLSIISMGQEGPAIWNLYASPLAAKSLFRAKLMAPFLVSLIPAVALPMAVSLIFGFTRMWSIALLSSSLILCTLAVFIGGYLASKYMDLEEKPRNAYVRGTGILIGYLELAACALAIMLPFIFYVFWKEYALSIGVTSVIAMLISAAIGIGFILSFYRLAFRSLQKVSLE
jgi:hypothetical protein